MRKTFNAVGGLITACSFIAVLALAACSAGHHGGPSSVLPAVPNFASQDVIDPFALSKRNVIHKYSLPHPVSHPQYVAMGSDKNVWFTESGGPRIGKISQAGVITEYTIPSGTTGDDIAPGASGFLWFSEASSIGKISVGGHVTEYPLSVGSDAIGLSKGPDGNMWFADASLNKIGKITPTGTVTEFTVPTSNAGVNDIVTGPDGNLWFTELTAPAIGKVTTAGAITEYASPGGFPSEIAVGPDNALYATYYGGVERITTSGVITTYPGVSGFNYNDISLGPDKQMWMTRQDGEMMEFNPKTLTFSNTFVPDPSSHVQGLAVGGDGDMWIAAVEDNSILVYEESLTSIGIRLNGELSFTDPNYGFELGYAAGMGTQTQTIRLLAGESVEFQNLDTIAHSAAFLGNATANSAPWPATFTGSTIQSPAFTPIGTSGFSTGSLKPNKSSSVYETGSPGFYMIGDQFDYVSSNMRTVIIVH
jgi:streptogramin lyase